MAISPQVYQFLIGAFAAFGSLLYGYDLSVVAEVISAESFLDRFHPSTAKLGLVASLFTGGAFFGAAIAGFLADRLGRRRTIIVGSVVFCLGGSLQTGAPTYSYIIAGRTIAGLAVGILTMVVPMYQAELVHPNIRGLVTGLVQLMLGIGGVAGSWISYGTYVSYSDSRQWRIPLGIQMLPAAVLGALILLFPESPRWLILKGKHDEGLQTLARLHAQGDTADPWVVAEFEQIKSQVAYEREHEASSFRTLFATKANRRRIVLGCAMQAATQITGVSAIQYYSVTIFSKIGISGRHTLKYQAINTIIGLLGELCVMLVIDRVGRRPIIVGGNFTLCLIFIISTILLAQFPPTSDSNGAHWAFIVMTWCFNFAFSSMGSLSWIIPAEIFDTKTRSWGVMLGTMTSFAFNTMIGQVTPIGMDSVDWRFYLLFVIGNFTNAVFFWSFLPETRQLPLEEMNRLFADSPIFVGGRDMSAYRNNSILELTKDNEKDQLDLEPSTHVEQATKM